MYKKGAPLKADVKFGGPMEIKLNIPIIITTNENPGDYLDPDEMTQLLNRAKVINVLYNSIK